MRSFAILLRKEEMALFSSPIAYAVMTVFLLIMGYSFTLTLFISHQPSMVHVFFQMFVLFMLTAPLITMRLLAEETKTADHGGAAHLAGLRGRDRAGEVFRQHEPDRAHAAALGLLRRQRWPGSAIPISDRSIAAISACCCSVRPWSAPGCWHRRSLPTR